ncbi:MAG: leucine-rich repeat domain-containing protein [Clostridia bacterium]|nr:leucine-rich repeat domain-containing protein [Clostridia bacterium]
MKKALSLLLALCLLLAVSAAFAEPAVSLDALMDEIEEESKALTVGGLSFEISENRQSVYISKPEVTGCEHYTIAYNIYDADSYPVNYFYSLEDRVAATPGYGGRFNVFVVVTDTDTGEQKTQDIGWQTLSWPTSEELSVSKATYEISPDRKSIFVNRPRISCASGSVTIAYNIYDAQSRPVNYFYSTQQRVAATPGYDGKFNVFIVVKDTETGEQDIQNIGWTILGEAPEETWPTSVSGVVYDLVDGRVTAMGLEEDVTELYLKDQVNGRWVTDIAESAFECPGGNGSLGQRKYAREYLRGPVTLPSHLERIGAYAFGWQSTLTGELILPETLTEIGHSAFAGTGFTSLKAIPESVKAVPDWAFAYSALTGEIHIPADCSVHPGAFKGVEALLSWDTDSWPCTVNGIRYALENGEAVATGCDDEQTGLCFADKIGGRLVTVIKEYAFSGADGMRQKVTGEVRLPRRLKTIEQCAFYELGITGSLEIPASVTAIYFGAFSECGGLNGSLELPDGLKELGDMAFCGCAFTGELTIPSGLTQIGADTFSHCSFRHELKIPANIKTIGFCAFRDCTKLLYLTLPDGLESIEEGAFLDCTGLEGTVHIPAGCQVHPGAFEGTSVTLVYD